MGVEPHRIEVSADEEMASLRDTIVALLRVDPHCPFANLLGQRLADLIAEQY